MGWISPVFDRTQEDVTGRKPKGFCNASDLNRLEGNCEVLGDLLRVDVPTRSWDRNDFPTVSEFARIRGNIEALRKAFYTYPATPDTPENPINTWRKFNDAEKILYDLHALYMKNLSAFYHTGELYAGEKIGVM